MAEGGFGTRTVGGGGGMTRDIPIHVRGACLKVAVLVARLGEKDIFNWWDSEALSWAGREALRRTFPHTWAIQSLFLACTAAREACRGLVPPGNSMTLFDLALRTGDLRQELGADEARSLVQGVEGADEYAREVAGSGANVESILVRAGACEPRDIAWVREHLGDVGERAVCIGKVAVGNLWTEEGRVLWGRRLAAAYVLGEVGRLVVPYIELS